MDKEKIELSYLRKKVEVLEHEKEELTKQLKTAEAEREATDIRSSKTFQTIKNLEYECRSAQTDRLEADMRAKKTQDDYAELKLKYLNATASNKVLVGLCYASALAYVLASVTMWVLYLFFDRNNTFLWIAFACCFGMGLQAFTGWEIGGKD